LKGKKKMSKKKNSLWKEFTDFAIKGNAMALAVGTIIGGAFSTITKSLTNDLIMPVVNIFLGGADFSEAKIPLPRMPWVEPTYETVVDATGAEVVQEVKNYLTYGNFISAVINFFILAIVVFLIVKGINKLSEIGKKKEQEAPPAPPAPSAEEVLLTEIRDLLKAQVAPEEENEEAAEEEAAEEAAAEEAPAEE
jgi:large conductance mechanosensitive channel